MEGGHLQKLGDVRLATQRLGLSGVPSSHILNVSKTRTFLDFPYFLDTLNPGTNCAEHGRYCGGAESLAPSQYLSMAGSGS